jgi:DnaJ-class molecular chaperone
VTPAYVCDRAATLLAALDARRRADLYRLLGVAPLASGEELTDRWDELVRTAHPKVGGDPERFRSAKGAWEVLRHPERRAEYERWWLRALGPFQRVPGVGL